MRMVEQAKERPAQPVKREENVFNIYEVDNIFQLLFVPINYFFVDKKVNPPFYLQKIGNAPHATSLHFNKRTFS